MPPYTKTVTYMHNGNAKVICLNCKATLEYKQFAKGKAFCRGCEYMMFFQKSTTFLGKPLKRDIAYETQY
jgi:hypothetical protein